MTSNGSLPSGPVPSTAERYHFSVRSQRLSRSMPKVASAKAANNGAARCVVEQLPHVTEPRRGIVSRPSRSA